MKMNKKKSLMKKYKSKIKLNIRGGGGGGRKKNNKEIHALNIKKRFEINKNLNKNKK